MTDMQMHRLLWGVSATLTYTVAAGCFVYAGFFGDGVDWVYAGCACFAVSKYLDQG